MDEVEGVSEAERRGGEGEQAVAVLCQGRAHDTCGHQSSDSTCLDKWLQMGQVYVPSFPVVIFLHSSSCLSLALSLAKPRGTSDTQESKGDPD